MVKDGSQLGITYRADWIQHQCATAVAVTRGGLEREQPPPNNIDLRNVTAMHYFTIARKIGNILLTYSNGFVSSERHQSMNKSYSDLMVDRNIFLDAVNVMGCALISPSVTT